MASITHRDGSMITPSTREDGIADPWMKRISWAAILAGVTVTLAIQIVLSLLGAGIGFGMIEPATGTTPYGRNVRLKGMLANTLRDAIAQGECRPDVDIDMVIDSLMAAYAWNYRRVLTDGADDVQMTALMDGQIGLLFDGLRPRA